MSFLAADHANFQDSNRSPTGSCPPTRLDARAVRECGPRKAAADAEASLTVAADAAWLDLDVDVLDEQALPATSYRQPGGLRWDELGRAGRAARSVATQPAPGRRETSRGPRGCSWARSGVAATS